MLRPPAALGHDAESASLIRPLRHVICSIARFALLLEHSMAAHRFEVGQTVELAPALSRNIVGGAYVVTRQLPEGPGELQYRIKSTKEPHERVVSESELRRTRETQ